MPPSLPSRYVKLPSDPKDAPEVAVVSAEPSSSAGSWLLRVARGTHLQSLTQGTAYGPFTDDALKAGIEELEQALGSEGFTAATDIDLILALSSPNPTVRGRSALRLAWRQCSSAVGPLLRAAESAKGEICSIVDALGQLGDPAGISVARRLAERKNLSRRRSGVEALRNLGDKEGLSAALERGLARLPEAVRSELAASDETNTSSEVVGKLVAAIDDPRRIGLVADVLYERATPLARSTSMRLLRGETIAKPHVWRYAKSVWKRAMLRHDGVVVAALGREIERAALATSGTAAVLKSGLDGKKREMIVFGPKTQRYMLRAVWRYMRNLARYRPNDYVKTASAALAHYHPGHDLRPAEGAWGALSSAFLLHQILYRESDRFVLSWHSLRHCYVNSHSTTRPKGLREEAFPELWDASPRYYLQLLLRARLVEVLDFAEEGLGRHPEVLAGATLGELISLADRNRDALTRLARTELTRRWELSVDEGFDLELLDAVVEGPETLVALADAWIRQAATAWAPDTTRLFRYLLGSRGQLRSAAAEAASAQWLARPVSEKFLLVDEVIARIHEGEPEDGVHGPMVRFALATAADELGNRLSLADELALVRSTSRAAIELGGTLLAQRDDALEALGLEGVVVLADSEVASVRGAAHRLLERARNAVEQEPAVLYALAESRWADTRSSAFAMLQRLPLERLGVDGVIGLCDSTAPEVQAFGRELTLRHFDSLSAETILFRLAEHPSRSMRTFALALIREHLRDGVVPLLRIEGFFRACLFDLYPDRSLKYGVVEFLRERGCMDARQAEVVVRLLDTVVRTQTKDDFQRVASVLAELQVEYPKLGSELSLRSRRAP